MNHDLDPKKALREAGFKATPGRVAFLELLAKAKEPLSIQDILAKLKNKSVDQATIYRIVDALRERGLIQYVNMEHGHAHIELVSPAHHHHAICQKCGTVVDISKCNIKNLENEVLKVSGFTKINRHALEFFGLCSSCGKHNSKRKK